MLDKIDLIPHEKLAVAFGYYVVNVVDRDTYLLYRNVDGHYLILYLDQTGEMYFIDMVSLRKLNRKEFLIFLADDMGEANVRSIILEANAIESYTEASFTKRAKSEELISGFLNLRRNKVFGEDNPLSGICFDKDGLFVSLLYPNGHPNGLPSEMINFDEDTESVKSYMGNDGLHISIKEGSTVHVTYHPFFLKDVALERESFIICKFNLSTFDLARILHETKGRTLMVPTSGKNSLLFKLRFLLKRYELMMEGLYLEMELSENRQYFSILWKLEKGSTAKLELFNTMSSVKRKLTALYDGYGPEVRDEIRAVYGLEMESLKFDRFQYGRIKAKYNTDLIGIFVGIFSKRLDPNL